MSVNNLTIASSPLILFRQGFITAAMNPKAFIFFTALLPHFIDPHRDIFLQFLCLAMTYVVIEYLNEFFFASVAMKIRPWLIRVGKKFNHFCGGVFIVLGSLVLTRE
ncbi:LysE family translocator [Acinetobacter sp. ANC 5383]